MSLKFTDEELRSICRRSIETLELWARRLINEKMTERYGPNYINVQIDKENYLIKKEIRVRVQSMIKKYPERYKRPVDTLFLNDINYFLCKDPLYNDLFKEALDYSYPLGKDEVHSFLKKLIPIRNSLSHANQISVRQVEQATCYSNDFVDGLKLYYKDKGMEHTWNVPRIIRITDSCGNEFYNDNQQDDSMTIFKVNQELYCGDTYFVTVEVDSTFSPEDYDIIWTDAGVKKDKFINNTQYITSFSERDVDQIHRITCTLKSHKEWHKHGDYDCRIILHLAVLPRE